MFLLVILFIICLIAGLKEEEQYKTLRKKDPTLPDLRWNMFRTKDD